MFQKKLYNNYVFVLCIVCCVVYCLLCIIVLLFQQSNANFFNKI